MKIYTKKGDDGSTGLFSGRRVPKTSSYIEAYGNVDELNAFLGSASAVCSDAEIESILGQLQHDLHCLCADLATPMDLPDAVSFRVERAEASRTERLENWIDAFESELTPLKQFILAGGSELSARLHLARTVARRAERGVIAHAAIEKVNAEIVVYLNRLSDLLFVMSRLANKRAGVSDVAWDKSK